MSDPVTPLTAQQTATQEAQAGKEGYAKREAVALDTFLDETADGPPGVTISSRWANWAKNYGGVRGFIGRAGCRFLNLLQANHGAKAAAGDYERGAEAEKYEKGSGLIGP